MIQNFLKNIGVITIRIKTPFIIAGYVILFLLSLGLFACAPKSPEVVLEESVEDVLNTFKDRDSYTMQRFAEYMDIQELQQFGIDPQDFARDYFDGFSYRIEDIEVGEDSATVYVVLTMKDYQQFQERLQTKIDGLVEDDAEKSYSADRFKELYGQIVMECVKETRATYSNRIPLVFTKDGNAWRPEKELFTVVASQTVK